MEQQNRIGCSKHSRHGQYDLEQEILRLPFLSQKLIGQVSPVRYASAQNNACLH